MCLFVYLIYENVYALHLLYLFAVERYLYVFVSFISSVEYEVSKLSSSYRETFQYML